MESPRPVERIVAAGANAQIAQVLQRHNFGKKLMLVCDDQTWLAAGQDVFFAVKEHYNIVPHSLGRHVRPSLQLADKVMEASDGIDGFLAVGAGCINDITKYVAAIRHKPYVAVATAASMNGYSSANASLEHEKFKRSFPAQPPRAVVADLTVLIAAPRRLTRAGMGDTLCRSTVEADMMMSHLLLGTPYPKEIFDALRKTEVALIAQAPDIRTGEPGVFELLMHALLDAGDAMTKFGSSAVASQGEHMIAHTAEMLYGAELHQITHGEIIAVATVSMNQLQNKMLLGTPTVRSLPREKKQFQLLFGNKIGPDLAADYKNKVLTGEEVQAITTSIERNWEGMRAEIASITHGKSTVERTFMQANIPHAPESIGLSKERYETAITHAHLTRDRFTFLDLAAMTGKRV